MLGMRTLVVPLLGFMCYHLQGPCYLSWNLVVLVFQLLLAWMRFPVVEFQMYQGRGTYCIKSELSWNWVLELVSEPLLLVDFPHVIFQVLAQIWEGPILKDESLNNFWLESEGLWSQVFQKFCDCGGHFCRCMHRERSVCVDPRFTFLSCSKDVPESPMENLFGIWK